MATRVPRRCGGSSSIAHAGAEQALRRQTPPVDAWHGAMADPTLAEAILDRVVHQAHRIAVKGHSMRKREPGGEAVA